ncbi:transposase [Sinorhizobium meliloti]|uniref:transposase n=1 Tax=Rhizobium meliloti TaxID=382 RepID=UPI003989EA78
MALLAANAAEIAALKAEKDILAQRVFKLEEELALARCIGLRRVVRSTLIASSMKLNRLPWRMKPKATTSISPICRTRDCHPSKNGREEARPQASAGKPAAPARRI